LRLISPALLHYASWSIGDFAVHDAVQSAKGAILDLMLAPAVFLPPSPALVQSILHAAPKYCSEEEDFLLSMHHFAIQSSHQSYYSAHISCGSVAYINLKA
jgi:hypothetical protein